MKLQYEMPIVRNIETDTITLVWELTEQNLETMGFTLCSWTNSTSNQSYKPLAFPLCNITMNRELSEIDGWTLDRKQRAYDFTVPVNTCRHLVHEAKKNQRKSP